MDFHLSSVCISAHDLIILKIPSRTELSSSSLVQSYTKPVLSPSTNSVSLPSTKCVFDVHTQPSCPACSPKVNHSFCPTSAGFLQPFGFPIGYSIQRSVCLFLPSGSVFSSLTQSSTQSFGTLSPPWLLEPPQLPTSLLSVHPWFPEEGSMPLRVGFLNLSI